MMKSGLGAYAMTTGDIMIGAIVVVNAVGDVYEMDTGRIIAGLLTPGRRGFADSAKVMYGDIGSYRDVFATNTTIGCIITNARLSKIGACKVAQMAHNGLARTIKPVHTSADGDALFTLASGKYDVSVDALGTLAADVVAKAVNRAVLTAAPAYGLPAASDFI